MVTVVPRPADLSGCLQSWTETTEASVLRSKTDVPGVVKVRRATTGIARNGDASITMPAAKFEAFRNWVEVDMQNGVYPSLFKLPGRTAEEAWRITEPVSYDWLDAKAFRATFKLERLPGWTP